MSEKTLKTRFKKQPLSRKTIDLLKEAEKLKEAGLHEEAIIILEKILTDNPDCTEAIEELANNFLSVGESEKAKKCADFVLNIDAESASANHVLGFLALYDDDFKTANRYLEKANKNDPNNPDILRCLGWGLYHQGETNRGIAILERSLNLDPENSNILCDLGICFLQEKKLAKARDLFEKAITIDPENERIGECLSLIDKIAKELG